MLIERHSGSASGMLQVRTRWTLHVYVHYTQEYSYVSGISDVESVLSVCIEHRRLLFWLVL